MKIGTLLSVSVIAFSICAASSSYANTSFGDGLQLTVFAGINSAKITPGNLILFGETDTLKPNHQHINNLTWGLGANYLFDLPKASPYLTFLQAVSVGIDFMHFQSTQNGEVWVEQHPSLNYYTYHIPIKSSRLMLNSEWVFKPLAPKILPFIEAGIGLAINNASYFDVPDKDVGGPGFNLNGHTSNQFAYDFGGGIKVPLSEHILLSLRYLYADLGHAKTAAYGSPYASSPIRASLTSHAWLGGFTYSL